jgi:hypothetical protein
VVNAQASPGVAVLLDYVGRTLANVERRPSRVEGPLLADSPRRASRPMRPPSDRTSVGEDHVVDTAKARPLMQNSGPSFATVDNVCRRHGPRMFINRCGAPRTASKDAGQNATRRESEHAFFNSAQRSDESVIVTSEPLASRSDEPVSCDSALCQPFSWQTLVVRDHRRVRDERGALP